MRWLRAVFSASLSARHHITLSLKRPHAVEHFERIFERIFGDLMQGICGRKAFIWLTEEAGHRTLAAQANVVSFVPFSELEISRNYFEGELLERSKSKLPMSRL